MMDMREREEKTRSTQCQRNRYAEVGETYQASERMRAGMKWGRRCPRASTPAG
ncbi:MAG: hypothetical protein OJF49_003280 [Ktedonobacterales bacterium]|nr:MAG: hypothetical protein OJF49_003280 [Ktedonobacterales bacterium]